MCRRRCTGRCGGRQKAGTRTRPRQEAANRSIAARPGKRLKKRKEKGKVLKKEKLKKRNQCWNSGTSLGFVRATSSSKATPRCEVVSFFFIGQVLDLPTTGNHTQVASGMRRTGAVSATTTAGLVCRSGNVLNLKQLWQGGEQLHGGRAQRSQPRR